MIKCHIKQFVFGHVNDTKGNVELHGHYEIFTVIWYFYVLSMFTPSLIHLRVKSPVLGLTHSYWQILGRNWNSEYQKCKIQLKF